MVQAVITLTEHEDRVVNAVKGKYGLKNKSQAIEHIILAYETELLDAKLRPEFIDKMQQRQKEPVVTVKDMREHF